MDFLSNVNLQLYLLAYLIGSIPFGYLLAKYIAKVDITKEGSKNIGATNVLRVVKQHDHALAKKLSILTLLFDALKGVAVLVVGHILNVSYETMWAIAVLSVVGHCFSIFLWGEGGKGVATSLGVLLYMIPLAAIVGILVWIVFAKVFKVVSLASLFGVLATAIFSFILYPNIYHAPIVIIAFIIIYKHTDNIMRLIRKEEKKITQ